MRFDKTLIDRARKENYLVYVDRETDAGFLGDEHGYDGDRVRIYPTGWEYEEPETFRTNEELKRFMEQD